MTLIFNSTDINFKESFSQTRAFSWFSELTYSSRLLFIKIIGTEGDQFPQPELKAYQSFDYDGGILSQSKGLKFGNNLILFDNLGDYNLCIKGESQIYPVEIEIYEYTGSFFQNPSNNTGGTLTASQIRDLLEGLIGNDKLSIGAINLNGLEIDWADINGKPNTYPPSSHNHDWQDINSKPTTYPPSSHNHDWEDITNKPDLSPQLGYTLTPGQTTRTLTVGTTERRYILYIPTNPINSIIFAFHGGGADPNQFISQTQLIALADTEKFICVFPYGTASLPNNPDVLLTWNAEFCCGIAAQNQVDDLSFVRLIKADLINLLGDGSAKFFACGFSNGALLCEKLLREDPLLFIGVASVAGVYKGVQSNLANPVIPVNPIISASMRANILMIHGYEDQNIPYLGGTQSDSLTNSIPLHVPPFNDGFQFWQSVNGVTSPISVGSLATEITTRTKTYNNRTVKAIIGLHCGHVWPGDPNQLTGVSASPYTQFSASQEIWDFFSSLEIASPPIIPEIINREGNYLKVNKGLIGFNSIAWGEITGNLSNQSDLQSYLLGDSKIKFSLPINQNNSLESSGYYFTDNIASNIEINCSSLTTGEHIFWHNISSKNIVFYGITSVNGVSVPTNKGIKVSSGNLLDFYFIDNNHNIRTLSGNYNIDWIPSLAPPTLSFTYSSNGDTNDIIYYLGATKYSQSFQNPHNRGDITVTASSYIDTRTPWGITSRNNGSNGPAYQAWHSNYESNSWVKIQFNNDKKARINRLSIWTAASHTLDQSLKFEGSLDGSNWGSVLVSSPSPISNNTWWTSSIFTNDNFYSYYRLRSERASTYTVVGDIQCYGEIEQ